MDWKNLMFSADGRIGRQAFWIAWLMLLGVNVVAGWVPVIGNLVALVTLYCFVCIYAKRLHDMGKSGWWQVVPIVLGPVLLIGSALWLGVGAAAIALNGGDPELFALAGAGGVVMSLLMGFVISIAFTLWVGCAQGETSDNRWGDPPLNALAV
ncbi:DUF805 domain-containing protein [Caulobacter endophyticus]|uniref:DUF805 domain-containing protein n=1 Tax=Caulobacter endophyticus TaxID=2172652 RepID=UPI00240FA46B|nr:DUF805 domain-containing protein [Caulobacter endophyticus]MDG2527538.1 DUF805 domain-containing protein [Caulobacter endophyticus]